MKQPPAFSLHGGGCCQRLADELQRRLGLAAYIWGCVCKWY
ncbi:MAG: hypothetical protein ACLR2G_12495 [Phascolarctobacterium faecium]